MTPTFKRRLGWLLLLLFPPLAYLLLREYADQARSMEAVLGLFHGDPTWHAIVATSVLVLRVAAYGVVGGILSAWPLEEFLLRRRAAAIARDPAPPDTGSG